MVTTGGNAMFLTKEEVGDLTGHARPAIQARWLRTNAIPFIIGGDGHPKVPKQSLLDYLASRTALVDQATEAPVCRLIDVTENWDKVSESMMAELLGTTAKALQGKRSRASIPPNVWSKVDGSILYSLKRYEAFLDDHWPVFTPAAATPKKPKTPRSIRHGNATQGKSIHLLV